MSQDMMKKRFENLKRMYFSDLSNKRYDEDGNEVPSVYPSKSQIVQMFETMGVELPTHPNDEMRIVPRRRSDG